jgi:hypothetical protein
MDVRIVRLNSGEEILCDLERDGADFLLKKPLIIIPTQDGQIGFMSWMPYAKTDDGVSIKNDFVAFVLEPDNQLIKEYTKQTSSVIIPDSTLSTVGPSLKLTE